MESCRVNLQNLTQIPENEFKEHFREWMEQDDVARCLQAKLRKDLIFNFNKTSLGKKLSAQTAVSRRLNLSPLDLALNTLVGEFLYAQNCHFTLSVFCTEVPHRNTLPDFEGVRHFRFSESELVEICDALSSNWRRSSKDEICKYYMADESSSLLFAVLKFLLYRPCAKCSDMPNMGDDKKPDKNSARDSSRFRDMTKLLKKVKEMSDNLSAMKADKAKSQSVHKSRKLKKLDSLQRSMQRICVNLRHMSVTKRKNAHITKIVSAINAMAKQFEKCAVGFHRTSQQRVGDGKDIKPESEKSYSDWVREMKTTKNGRKFLEKVEHSLNKALQKEKAKLQEEFQKRMQIQKSILKVKYKQRLTEAIARFSAREKSEYAQQLTEVIEQRMKEFEEKAKEIREEMSAAKSTGDFLAVIRATSSHKNNQTSLPVKTPSLQESPSPRGWRDSRSIRVRRHSRDIRDIRDSRDRDQDCDNDADNAALHAKQRVEQLEEESDQLERSLAEFLNRQKHAVRPNTTSILHSYARDRSILEKRCAAYRSQLMTSPSTFPTMIENIPLWYSKADLGLNADEDGARADAFHDARSQSFGATKVDLQEMEQFSNEEVNLPDEEAEDESTPPPSPPCRAATKVTLITAHPLRLKENPTTSADTDSGESGDKAPLPDPSTTLVQERGHKAKPKVREEKCTSPKLKGIQSKSSIPRKTTSHGEQAKTPSPKKSNHNGGGDAIKVPDANEKATTDGTNVPEMGADIELSTSADNQLVNRSDESADDLDTDRSFARYFRYFYFKMGEVKPPK